MDLSEYPTKDLQAEIERRENQKPKKLHDIDFQPLIEIAEKYILSRSQGKRFKDAKHYIYETAIECIYGKEIWDWINSMPDNTE